jgi:hypothetical protein
MQSGGGYGRQQSPKIAHEGVVEVTGVGKGTIRVGSPTVGEVRMCVKRSKQARAVTDGNEAHPQIDVPQIDAGPV